MKRGPDDERIQVAVVGSIWGFRDKTDNTVIYCIQFAVESVGGYFVNDIAKVKDQ
jgi:hypothetical protein